MESSMQKTLIALLASAALSLPAMAIQANTQQPGNQRMGQQQGTRAVQVSQP
jgi:hypothetical protein